MGPYGAPLGSVGAPQAPVAPMRPRGVEPWYAQVSLRPVLQ